MTIAVNGTATIRELRMGAPPTEVVRPARVTAKRVVVRLCAQTMTFDRATGRRIDAGVPFGYSATHRVLIDAAVT